MLDFHRYTTSTERIARRIRRAASTATMSLGVAALMLNTACYSYSARSIADLRSGDVVSVAITPSGRELVSQNVGDSVAVITGKYVSDDVAGLHVAVTDAQFLSGISAPRDGINLTLPRTAYDSVSTKKFAAASTGWVVLLVVGGLAALIKGMNVLGGGTSKTTPPPPPPVHN